MNNILSKEKKEELNNVISKKALDNMSEFDDLLEISNDDVLAEVFDKMNQDDKSYQESRTSEYNVADEQLEYLKTLN